MLQVLLTVILLTRQTLAVQDFYVLKALENLTSIVSPKCETQLEKFISNFSISENSWALQMIDATSKLPSGLLNYNFGEMGDFHGCISIEAGDILGKYCLGYLAINQSSGSKENETAFGSLGSLSQAVPQTPTWALCLPNGCTTTDANIIGNVLLQQVLNTQIIGVGFTDLLCQTRNEVSPELTGGAIATIIILVLLAVIVLISTLYDLYSTFYGSKSSPMLVKGFSVYTNSQKIFKMSTPNPDQLPCLNGLKFISMMWVVVGHQFSIPLYGSITNTKNIIQWADKLYSMFLISGTLSVDTFFTIGGTLMAYGYMKAKQKKIPFNIFLYYIHRYLRLTAPFSLVVLVSSTLLQYMGSGPKYPFILTYFQKNCQEYWWSSLLYVQNYVNVSKMCVGQTWYLNIDMQLYLVSPFILFALWKYSKLAFPFLAICSLVFMGLSFYEAWDNELPAILSNLYSTHSADYQNKYYLLTHTRATPWVIGICLGYFLFKIKQKEINFKLHKIVVLILWALCISTLLVCVLCGHSSLRGPDYDKWGNALHITLVRPSWSLAITWIILACTNNYGGPINWILSLPIFQVFNRFTYGIYLTHVTMLYIIAYGREWPDYFSGFNMMYQFWGTLWLSTGLSAILVFTTESPMIVIEKILFGSIGKKKQLPKTDTEKGIDNTAFEG